MDPVAVPGQRGVRDSAQREPEAERRRDAGRDRESDLHGAGSVVAAAVGAQRRRGGAEEVSGRGPERLRSGGDRSGADEPARLEKHGAAGGGRIYGEDFGLGILGGAARIDAGGDFFGAGKTHL